MSPTLTIQARSGLVTGLTEAIILLILSPIITRGTVKLYNHVTTRHILRGSLVRISDTSSSVEDIIPRTLHLLRTITGSIALPSDARSADTARQASALSVSLFMAASILLLNIFTDGVTVPIYKPRRLLLWNGGRFVDTTKATGLDSAAWPVAGMEGAASACVRSIDAGTFEMYALAFDEKTDFGTRRSVSGFLCLDGNQTRDKVGIRVSTNALFSVPEGTVAEDVPQVMKGSPARFEFVRKVPRGEDNFYCQVRVEVQGRTERWTLGHQLERGAAFAARATRDGGGKIMLKVGVAYLSYVNETTPYARCEQAAADMLKEDYFTAAIYEMDITQVLEQLELVVLDRLRPMRGVLGGVESQEVMLTAYYAGVAGNRSVPVDEQELGTFVARQVPVRQGESDVTRLQLPALIGMILTLAGASLLLIVAVSVPSEVRLTSTSYLARLYRGKLFAELADESGDEGCSGPNFIYGVKDSDGKYQVRLLCGDAAHT